MADALEYIAPGGESTTELLAHHLWAAGPLADPARTTSALIRAGHRAATKSALEAAAQHLTSAAQVARSAGLVELELSAVAQLTAVVGMQSGYVASVLDVLVRAEQLARSLGREREATDFLYSRGAAYSQSLQLERSGQLARQMLEQGQASSDPVLRAYGLHSWGIHQWDLGNIGEAFTYLSQLNQAELKDLTGPEESRLRRDLQLLSPVILAQVTALHGDVDAARARLDAVASAAGDDPHAVTLAASFASTTAALAGDPGWALRAVERGLAADPTFSYVFYGTFLRVNQCWARAVTGQDPAAAAAEAEALITAALLDPPLTGVSTRYGLVGEMWLAAGELDKAEAALDRADHFLSTYGQRYAEGFVLLLRAQLLQACGESAKVVRGAAERARDVSLKREAHLFAHRAENLLIELDSGTP